MDAETKERFDRIDAILERLASQRLAKESYSLPEVAKLVDRSVERVRKWCQEGRLSATKVGRGRCEHGEWRVSREEIERYRAEGLRPESDRPRLPSPFPRPGARPIWL